ncbi:MAG: type II toxin-antitoxin system VapC family toxin [Phycisphaeraceae bacterium]
MFVLDTDHISLIQRSADRLGDSVRQRCESTGLDQVFVTIVSFHEQSLGWNTVIQSSRRMEQVIHGYERFELVLAQYANANVLPFDERAAVEFQRIKAMNLRVGTMDLRIAAITVASGKTLLTRNTRDFGRIVGLKLDDWTKSP